MLMLSEREKKVYVRFGIVGPGPRLATSLDEDIRPW